MKTNFKKILNELSYRVSTGIPDLTNEQHLIKLWDILKEHNWNIDARVELLKNLDEMSIVKNKKSGNVYPVKKFKPQTQTIVKKNATKDDIEKAIQYSLNTVSIFIIIFLFLLLFLKPITFIISIKYLVVLFSQRYLEFIFSHSL